LLLLLACFFTTSPVIAQKKKHKKTAAKEKAVTNSLEQAFLHPSNSAKPWVFWYWMHGAVSTKGITADLEAMKAVGIAGAYLMPIKDTSAKIPYEPTSRQLSKAWWEKVRFAMSEAKRLNLQIGMHLSDGFALAGGPWIKPEASMQKMVWTKTMVKGGSSFQGPLQVPEQKENYYQDIAVFAYPLQQEPITHSSQVSLQISSSKLGLNVDFLKNPASKETFRSDSTAWIQYQFQEPFTCRSLVVKTAGNNYQAQRLLVQTSDDGLHFKDVKQLLSPRHGWQDNDEEITHSIPATKAKYFRFVFDKTGTEAGSEDLDAAKWKPTLKLNAIELSSEALVNQYESKNGSVWRVSERTTEEELPQSLCIQPKELIDISSYFKNGELNWNIPAGNWVILRMGHTSTGHKNETGGAGKGLEADKFNEAAIKLQYNSWFGKAFEMAGPAAKDVLKVFHVDSWECGSQNWSANFEKEFQQRRGYALRPFLPVVAGVPIASAKESEQVLLDIRKTISELVNDVFYKTLKTLAHKQNTLFSAESIAPTMMSDGLLHYSQSDLPMGEFWLRSPTHDKPNDMLDAISGGHIYGKKIIQSESFTELRMAWDEHPGMLKAIGDRNLALGVNKLVFHVMAHNPWMDKKPGMTLDGVGLYFQRDQTWFKQAKAWLDYLSRTQALLQQGKPVVDIAVFTGEELPSRSLLPNRLVNDLPGLFGSARLQSEKERLANIGQPQRTLPEGVTHSAKMADPENWINPLNGYAYDCFNPDALLRLAKVENGKVIFANGSSYSVLVFPSKHPMMPYHEMSMAVAKKIKSLMQAGATILIDPASIGSDSARELLMKALPGKGKMVGIPFIQNDFSNLGIAPDLTSNAEPGSIAYNHRSSEDGEIYFISNQSNQAKDVEFSLRVSKGIPEIWNPVTGKLILIGPLKRKNGRTLVDLHLEPSESFFIVFPKTPHKESAFDEIWELMNYHEFKHNWRIQFDTAYGGPTNKQSINTLASWTVSSNPSIKYYSGTAIYSNTFFVADLQKGQDLILDLGEIYDIASVQLNGIDCGTVWTTDHLLNLSKAIKKGKNELEIKVTNTWYNRLLGESQKATNGKISFTTAPLRMDGKSLLKAGLIGPVKLYWKLE
jgi:hypothetical protein